MKRGRAKEREREKKRDREKRKQDINDKERKCYIRNLHQCIIRPATPSPPLLLMVE